MVKSENIAPRRYGTRRRFPKRTTSIKRLWEGAERLADAWLIFAEDYPRERWRDAEGESAKSAHAILLQAELVSMLRHGELRAVAIRESSDPYDGPEIIPADLFDGSRESVLSIFSDTSRLTLAGRNWVQVRITECRYTPRKPKLDPRDPKLLASTANEQRRKNKTPFTRGRPSIDVILDKIVTSLDRIGELKGLPRKEQEHRVRAKARLDFPNVFTGEKRPSRPKILEALARAGYGGNAGT